MSLLKPLHERSSIPKMIKQFYIIYGNLPKTPKIFV